MIDASCSSFLEDAAKGKLPPVSWIDPNFKDLNLFGGNSNDDHPPSDVREGQHLVLAIYQALAESPQWQTSMLIVTYDEHGGFFDHVPPPTAPDDNPAFRQYGIRVPAIVVSPFVAHASVTHTLFDHTSIIKTILTRFCSSPKSKTANALPAWADPPHPDYLGLRVTSANHLGELLVETSARPAPSRDALLLQALDERTTRLEKAVVQSTPQSVAGLTELQVAVAQAARELRNNGLPPGQP